MIQPFVSSNANEWRAWFWLGTAQLLQQDLENASDSFDRALAINGDEVSIWIQRALVEQEKKQWRSAKNFSSSRQ